MGTWHTSGVGIAASDEDSFTWAFSWADVGAAQRPPMGIDQEAACSSI